jgi:hypothetical protein
MADPSMITDDDVRLIGTFAALAGVRIHRGQLLHVEDEVLGAV